MTIVIDSNNVTNVAEADGLTANDLVSTNWQTTAAVGLTVASGGVGGAIMLAAFPAQTIGAVGSIGALAYAGKRRADGKSAFPFMDKDSEESKDSKKSESKKEDKPVAEAAA